MTGCERILARLERGPATAAELYATTYTIVHSRVSELRRRGYVIDCDHVDASTQTERYVYQLKASPSPILLPAERAAAKAGDGPESTPGPSSTTGTAAAVQLSLLEAT